MQYTFVVDDGLVRRAQEIAADCGHTTLDEVIALSLKEWCENREYLLSPTGARRFPSVSALVRKAGSNAC